MKKENELGDRWEEGEEGHRQRKKQARSHQWGSWAPQNLADIAYRIERQYDSRNLYVPLNENGYLGGRLKETLPLYEKQEEKQGRLANGRDEGHFIRIYTKEDVEQYLALSDEWDAIPLDSHLFCVLNTGDYLPWKEPYTLVFYDDGLVLKTKETTNAIMERLFKKIGIRYNFMRSMFRVLERKKPTGIPYTCANTCYLPINGPSKNPVTWISLSHVMSYEKVKGERNKLRLEFRNRHRIELVMRPDTFESHLTVAAQTLATQYHLLQVCLSHFGMEAVSHEQRYTSNILHQWLRKNTWNTDLNLGDMGRLLFLSEFEELRRHPTFKDNPFTEEIWNHLNERTYAED